MSYSWEGGTMEQDLELETSEVARRMGVAPSTVQRWCRAGLLPGARLGISSGRITWFVPASALESFVPPVPGRHLKRKGARHG